jgi:DNA-binding MarR family transcriptional regulator
MDMDILTKFGMTPTEAKIYGEIGKYQETAIGPIIKKSGLHRGTVYNSINNLIKKGFVSFIDKQETRKYRIIGESIFKNIIDEKNRELKENQLEAEKLLNDLNKLKATNDNQEVAVYYGLQSFKELFLDLYGECKKDKLDYLFLGEGGKMADAVGNSYYKYTQDLKKKMKIPCRIILSKETKSLPYRKHTIGNIRYLPTKISSPVNFWIYGNKVLLVLWDSNPLISIKIESLQLANGFRNYFEYLWGISK